MSSAPEVFQREMHELIEGLRGVEVIADDFVVVGYGESWQSAINNQQWPGNDFPNFRLAEEKTKLDELAASVEEECSIPEISFGFEAIKKHIQSVFNERRRSRKRERIDYDLVGSYIKYTILLKAISCHTCLHAVRIRTL